MEMSDVKIFHIGAFAITDTIRSALTAMETESAAKGIEKSPKALIENDRL